MTLGRYLSKEAEFGSLFVRIPWSIDQLVEYGLKEPNEGRWDALLRYLGCFGVLMENHRNACVSVRVHIATLEKKRLPTDRLRKLKMLIESGMIPTARIPPGETARLAPKAIPMSEWERSEFSTLPFHYAHCKVGEQALEALRLACWAHRTVDVIDPYILSDGNAPALRKLALFANRNGVSHVTGSGSWSPLDVGEREASLPGSRAEGIKRANQVFRETTIQWEFKLHPTTKTERNLFHDRFLVFRANQRAGVERIVFAGRGVGSFGDSGDRRSTLVRVPADCWEKESRLHDDWPGVWLSFKRGDRGDL